MELTSPECTDEFPIPQSKSFLGSVGVRLSEAILSDSGAVFTPEVRARYVHDFDSDNPVVLASLPGLSPTTFAISGARPARDYALLGFSVAAKMRHDLDAYISYNGQFSNDQTVHAEEAGLRFRF